MRPTHERMPSSGTSGTRGARNGRSRSGRVCRKIHTPAHTRTNARRTDVDPGAEQLQRQEPGREADRNAGVNRGEVRRAEPRMDLAAPSADQAVAGYRVEH